jgi:hypothetical protein
MRLIQKIIFIGIFSQGLFLDSIIGHNLIDKTVNYKDTCKCNYNCWPDLKDSINELSIIQIYRFLKTISVDCENNAEFSECSNDRLFKIMELNPDNFLIAIDTYSTDLEIGEILRQIKRPVNDGINLMGIYTKIQKSKVESGLRDQILKLLKYSIDLNK